MLICCVGMAVPLERVTNPRSFFIFEEDIICQPFKLIENMNRLKIYLLTFLLCTSALSCQDSMDIDDLCNKIENGYQPTESEIDFIWDKLYENVEELGNMCRSVLNAETYKSEMEASQKLAPILEDSFLKIKKIIDCLSRCKSSANENQLKKYDEGAFNLSFFHRTLLLPTIKKCKIMKRLYLLKEVIK